MADEKQNNTNTKQGTTENIDAAQNDTAINEEQTSSNLDDFLTEHSFLGLDESISKF